MTQRINHPDELPAAARQLIADAGTLRVWLFEGEMGAGKTTLIKAICEALGVVSVVQSPTFGLVNEYTTQTGDTVYHFDCYRLRNEAEALDIGLDEYLDSGKYCFIEWPKRIESLWPPTFYLINLAADASGLRTLTAENVQ
jgi:tRNA threonylcarbamoyladenosine biosynthesis protein TsaE